MNDILVNIVLFSFLVAMALVIIRLHDLFAAAMLLGIFSLLSARLFTAMDAVDVAFTEAAVGAGISTVLFLGTLLLTKREERPELNKRAPFALFVVILLGSALIYATIDMPAFGDPQAPIHHHVMPRYMEWTRDKIGIPNVVTAVLASYRGYDTFGETTVIFTAGIGVILGLGALRRISSGKRNTAAEAGAEDDSETGGGSLEP